MAKDKRTVLVLDWSYEKGSSSVSIDKQGDTLPDEIKLMLVTGLLHELRGKYEIDLRGIR